MRDLEITAYGTLCALGGYCLGKDWHGLAGLFGFAILTLVVITNRSGITSEQRRAVEDQPTKKGPGESSAK